MVKTTPEFAFSYPEAPDHTRTWEWWQTQIEQIEAKLKNGFRTRLGDIAIGDPTSGITRALTVERLDTADAIMAQFFTSTGGVLHIRLLKNGAEVNKLIVLPNGAVQVTFGGVARPIPFAMHALQNSVLGTGTQFATKVVTYPAGRFTAAPVVSLTSISYQTAIYATDTTAASATVYAYNTGAFGNGVTYGFYLLATQMTPTTGPGLLSPAATPRPADLPPTISGTATCHTDGCGNADIPLTIETPSAETPVDCGVCGQPITDLDAV